MTLTEFDKIRPYLPDTVTVELGGEPPQLAPKADEVWAVELCSWGNHDGRFNVMCAACGDVGGGDIKAHLWNTMAATYQHKPCPKCGKTFIKRKDIRR